MKSIETKKIVKFTAAAVIGALLVVYFGQILTFAGLCLHVLSPLILGGALAFVLNILLKKLEKIYFPNSHRRLVQKSRRPVCIVLSIVLLLLIIMLIIRIVVPELFSCLQIMWQAVPPLFEKGRLWLLEHSDQLPAVQEALQNSNIDWQGMLKNTLEAVWNGAGGAVSSIVSVVSGMIGGIAQVAIACIFALYLLAGKERLLSQLQRLLRAYVRPDIRDKIQTVCTTANDTFSKFIGGQFTEAVIVGVLCTLGMLLLRFPYAMTIGIVVGVTALVPVVGAYIGAVLGAVLIASVSPLQALLFLIYLVVLQQLEGNLIYPRVVGPTVGLPGIWVLAAVIVGGGLFGVTGIFLGVPLAATIYKLLSHETSRRLQAEETPLSNR